MKTQEKNDIMLFACINLIDICYIVFNRCLLWQQPMQLMKICLHWGSQKGVTSFALEGFAWKKIQKSESKERLKEKKGLLEKVLERNKSKRRFEASNGLPHKKSRGKAPGGSGTKKYRLGGCITVTSRKGIFLLDKTRVVVPETFMFHLLQQQT